MKFLSSLFGSKNDIRVEDGNPALVQAMHELASNETTSNREKVYKTLLESMLLVPVPEIPRGFGSGMQASKNQIRLQLTATLDRNQRRVTPAFTDVEALRNWDPNTPYLGIKAQELFRFVTETDIQEIVINPFDSIRKMIRPGGRVTRWEAEVLCKGVIPSGRVGKGIQFRMKSGKEVMIGLPAQKPNAEVEKTLRTLASSVREIEELYLFQMATGQGSEWSSQSVIGIQLCKSLPETEENEISRQLGDAVQAKLKVGESLDFLVIRGDFGKNIKAKADLIFKRPGP